MSAVVLRCSNCGTVQAGTGECAACHEAQVRYFCTNHRPGLWLETPACPQCGARFGQPAPVPPVPDEAERPARTHSPQEAVRPSSPRRDGSDDWRTVPDGDAPGGLRRATAGTLLEALAYATRARSLRKARAHDVSDTRSRPAGGGCIGRLFLLTLLVAAFFLLAPLLLGGALLRVL